MEKEIKHRKFMLVGHVSEIIGPGHHLRDFLLGIKKSGTKTVLFPMLGTKLDKITVDSYIGRKRTRRKKIAKKQSTAGLIKDFLFTLKEIWKIDGKIDCYVGLNNFDTLPAVLFKGWKVKKIIYYGSDYADRRFENVILNSIYRAVELIVLTASTLVVSNTKRAQNRRIELGLNINKAIVIPNGVDLSLIPKVKRNQKHQFVYLGYLSETHGILNLLKVFGDLANFQKSATMALVGSGPAESQISKFVRKNGLENNVTLVGRLEHKEALRFMKKNCSIGIASYNTREGWTKYASPLKVKEYLACGLVVVVSDVPEISQDIRKYKMGYVYSSNKQLYEILKKLSKDTDSVIGMQQNALAYIRDYDWNKMYKARLLPHII